MYVGSPSLLVGINPGGAFNTSGIRLTMLAHVNSTVLGCFTVIVVSGSPIIVHSLKSTSSLAYTLPIHSASIIFPYSVSEVTMALIPVVYPDLITIFSVLDSIFSI